MKVNTSGYGSKLYVAICFVASCTLSGTIISGRFFAIRTSPEIDPVRDVPVRVIVFAHDIA